MLRWVKVGNTWALGGATGPISIGPHWPMLLCTYVLVLVPSCLFAANVLATRAAWEQAIFVVLFAATLASFTITAFKNPGILPKSPLRDDDTDEEGGISFSSPLSVPAAGAPPHTPVRRRVKFCKYCNVGQPLNSVHCQDCDVCILDLDHHCPWTGKCIGKGNIQFFSAFLMSLIAHGVAVIVMTVQYFSDTGSDE